MSSRPSSGGPRLRRLNMGQVFIILAVISAVLTIVILKNLMSNKVVSEKEVKIETKPIVVATSQIFSGEPITSGNVKVVDWPTDHYPEADVYKDLRKIKGRVAKTTIFSGEPVFRLSLAGEESRGGMPVVIPSGQRAMTILVNENKGVAGFVKPGDRVDVIGTFEFDIPEETQKAISGKSGMLLEDSLHATQTVLQDVQVLAIAQDMYSKKSVIEEGMEGDKEKEKEKDEKKDTKKTKDATKAKVVSSVTLSVTPEQAEKLAYAEARGELRLSLRPENEHEQVQLLGAFGNDIMPLSSLYEKALSFTAGLDPDLLTGGFSGGPGKAAEASQDVPPIASTASFAPAARNVEVIEGVSKSSVSF